MNKTIQIILAILIGFLISFTDIIITEIIRHIKNRKNNGKS